MQNEEIPTISAREMSGKGVYAYTLKVRENIIRMEHQRTAGVDWNKLPGKALLYQHGVLPRIP